MIRAPCHRCSRPDSARTVGCSSSVTTMGTSFSTTWQPVGHVGGGVARCPWWTWRSIPAETSSRWFAARSRKCQLPNLRRRDRSGHSVDSVVAGRHGSVAWSPDGSTLATPRSDGRMELWDIATGIRRASLEGLTGTIVGAGFRPAAPSSQAIGLPVPGCRLRWDTVLGRPIMSVSSTFSHNSSEFSQQGRIVISVEDVLTTYEVDPAASNIGHLPRFPLKS